MAKELTRGVGSGLSEALRNPHGIVAPVARAAHLRLLDNAAQMNLRAEPHTSAITSVKLYDGQGRYVFSWIINAHHLLFYIRKPALKLVPGLAVRAQTHLSGVKVNPAGEVTIRLETVADVDALSRWLHDPTTWTVGRDVEALSTPAATTLPSSGAARLTRR